MFSLRDYQERGVGSVRQSFRTGHKAPLAVAPTGAGKTVLFSDIAASAASKGNRVTITAHRLELLKQISKALTGFGITHGIIAPGFPETRTFPVQVAGVQALAARMKKRDYETDLLIIDEGHHFQSGNSWGKVYRGLGEPRVLGVTASPIRGDGKGLGVSAGGVFDDLIDIISVQELIDDAYLVQPISYAPAERLDLSGLRTRGGDYEREQLEERIDKPTITGDAVDHYRKLCPGETAIAFGVSIDHCRHIAAQFSEAGYRFEVIDGSMSDRDRAWLIGALGKEITGLVSCDLVGEGVDIPAISVAILMRPTKSLGLHIQQMGRALRPIYAAGMPLTTADERRAALQAAGKTRAIILDHVGNTLVHGLAEQPREWSLEGQKKKPKGKRDEEPPMPVRQCEVCYAVFAPGPVCPNGHVQTVQSREIETVDGELRQITPEMAAALKKAKRIEVARAKSLEELEKLADARGYNRGWAHQMWKGREQAAQRKAEAQAKAYGR